MEKIGRYIYVADDYYLDPAMISMDNAQRPYIETILLTNQTVADRIRKLSESILTDFAGKDIIFICVLRGAFRFSSDLMARIEEDSNTSPNFNTLEFIKAKSYVGDEQGEVVVQGLDEICIENKNVVVLEDMVDKGKTLARVTEIIRAKNPKELKVCVLAYKRNPENTLIVPDYIGFSLPNKWIVGYNIDYNGYFRNLPHIAALNSRGKEEFMSR